MLELATFLGSYSLSFLSTLTSKRMDIAKQQHHQLMQLAGLREQSTVSARTHSDRFSKTTRRVLALIVGTLLASITLGLSTAWLNIPVMVEISQTSSGFWPFTNSTTTTEFVEVTGALILPEYRLILLSVFGLYFGNNHAR